MTQTATDLESTFQGAWRLLLQNPIIVVPGLVLGAIATAVLVVIAVLLVGSVLVTGATGSATVGIASIGATLGIAVVLMMIVAIAQTAFVTGMAGAAWERGKTTLADGWTAFSNRAGQMLYAIVLLIAIGFVALVLAPFTFLLSLFAYMIFFIYVSASVIIGGRDAVDALGESWRLARSNFWPTTGIAALIVCVSFLAAFVGGELSRVEPFVGGLAAVALQQAAVAYAAMVVVGEYDKLCGKPPAA